jgi:hypothetical protein
LKFNLKFTSKDPKLRLSHAVLGIVTSIAATLA